MTQGQQPEALRRLHAENTALQQGYDAARMEIEGLRDRVQELGTMLRENLCKRIVELEAQLEAIGAGGVEPLRRRECLHQISEPAGYTVPPGYRLQPLSEFDAMCAAQSAREQHPDDDAVDALAKLMKAKLAKQRTRGYGGWDATTTTQQRLSDMLRAHVDKGDPVDVANFCAFLAARGEGIAHAAPAAVAVPSERWRERWHGSPTEQGWSIMHGRECIAYLGPDVSAEAVSAIVAAHNAAPTTHAAPAAQGDGHSTACLYQYALARLGIADSKEMRVIFWDAHEALKWDDKTDSYLPPVIDDDCAICGAAHSQAKEGGA